MNKKNYEEVMKSKRARKEESLKVKDGIIKK